MVSCVQRHLSDAISSGVARIHEESKLRFKEIYLRIWSAVMDLECCSAGGEMKLDIS